MNHGIGTLQLKNNRNFDKSYKYVGEFKDGQMYGFGLLTYENGEEFEGFFENGRKKGLFMKKDTDGLVILALFNNNNCGKYKKLNQT